MQLTISGVPDELKEALRAKAAAEGKTLDQIAIEALAAAARAAPKKRDLSAVAGTWVDDPVYDDIRREHDSVDGDLWR